MIRLVGMNQCSDLYSIQCYIDSITVKKNEKACTRNICKF